MRKSRSFIATPPGVTIKEQLLDRGFNQKEFALRMDMSEKHISKLLNGEVQLTPDVAYRLEMVLGVPARFWNNLEAIYREKLIKVKAENEMDEDKEIVKKLPYREMVKYGWIDESRSVNDKVVNLRKFFEVSHLSIIERMNHSTVVCRRLGDSEKSDYCLLTWVQKARIESRNIETSPIDLKSLETKLLDIRNMTSMDPSDFCPRLVEMLADCGIALVFLPHIGGSFLHGATFWDGKKIVVGLSLRGKDADKFWFSLFHELGHILLGHINQVHGTSEKDEIEADDFAREFLISTSDFNQFISYADFSNTAICRFAKKLNLLPSIVVGRLQKEGYIPYNCCNELKIQYECLN